MKVLKLLTLLTILHSYVVKLPCVEITNVSGRVAKRPFASQWDKILSQVAYSFFKKLLYLSEYFLLISRDCKGMQISLGNSSVSAVIYNDSAVRKENSVLARNKKKQV